MSEATVALAPNAMTTLEDTMERLGISEEEADQATKNNLVRLINAASAWIETITGRHFGKATYTDRYAGPGAQELVLREYPIRSVEYVKDTVTGGLIDPGTYDFSMSGDIGVLYRDMGWTFRGYPYPESVTWKFKRPQGIAVPDLTKAERDALEEANVNFLTVEYKREYVKNGTCLNGEFIDVQMGADYIAKTMRENLYDIFLENAKIGYTDEGFAIIADGVFQALNRAVDLGIIALDTESGQGVYTVTVPKRSEATDEQARNRQMPDITWEAQLEGAVHGVKVKGTLQATLSA